MTNIPVGTKLKITEYVPLPEPRPRYFPEEPFSGTFNLDNLVYHPWVEMKETGKVGIELMKEQLNTILNWIYSPIAFLGDIYQEAVARDDFLLSGIGISVLAVIAVSCYYLISKLFK